MLVKEYFWESFLAVQAAITFTHHLADCHILLFIFSSILSHVWNNCWLQFEEHACAALSAQPWRCHPLHTKLSIVYTLAFFCCNENNYGWKHFANDEVVRASIWNIWFQLCQEVTFNLGFKPATGELKEQSGRWAVVVHDTKQLPCVCKTRCSELPVLTFGCRPPCPGCLRQSRKGFANQTNSVFCALGLNLQCSKGLKKVRSHLPEFSLFPAMIPQHFSDFQGFGGEKKQCVKQLPNLPMQLVESTGNFDVKFMN